MRQLKNHLLILIIVVTSFVNTSKVWSQSTKIVTISEGALAVAKGREAKKDSLLQIQEIRINNLNSLVSDYKNQVERLNNQIKLNSKQYELVSLNTSTENLLLVKENKTLKKEKRFWKTVAIGIPTAIVSVAAYLVLK